MLALGMNILFFFITMTILVMYFQLGVEDSVMVDDGATTLLDTNNQQTTTQESML